MSAPPRGAVHTAVMVGDGGQLSDKPSGPHCGADGCIGVRAESRDRCIAHLDETSLQQVLAGLDPGADLDVRGVPFSAELLERLLTAVRDPGTGRPRVGTAGFRLARFTGRASFGGVEFEGKAVFADASFNGPARFQGANFSDGAWVEGARFGSLVVFNDASFSADAFFNRAHFGSLAWFQRSRFGGNAWFSEARFDGVKLSESDEHVGPCWLTRNWVPAGRAAANPGW